MITPPKVVDLSARSFAIIQQYLSGDLEALSALVGDPSAATLTNRSKSCSHIADGRNDIWPRPPGSPQTRGTPVPPAMWGMSRSAPGCSSSPEAVEVCRWPMASWSAGRGWDLSAG